MLDIEPVKEYINFQWCLFYFCSHFFLLLKCPVLFIDAHFLIAKVSPSIDVVLKAFWESKYFCQYFGLFVMRKNYTRKLEKVFDKLRLKLYYTIC